MNEESFFRSIYERMEVPIFVLNTDGDFTFGDLNPACEKATGLRKPDVVGKRPEKISGLPKESATALRTNCQHCLKINDIVRFEEPVIGRDQGIWWLTQLAPVRDEAGEIVRIIGFSVDITDRKRAEDASRESELRYREVFENISDCIFIIDVTPDGRFKFAEFNPAEEESVGYTSSEVSGKLIEEVLPAELARQVTAGYQRCLEAGTSISYDEEFSLPTGSRCFHTILVPVLNVSGKIYRIIGVARDITERQQMEQEYLTHLRFLENIDRINRAVQASNDLEQMMSDVLDEVLSIFDCDRAFLLYPCDPESASWSAPMERTKPEYPGAHAIGFEAPMDPDVARVYRLLLEADGPVKFGPDYVHSLPQEMSMLFGYKSQILMALYPKTGAPWVSGLHQCSYPRAWTVGEERLFQEIGHRLEDALTSLLMYRNLQNSEERYRMVFENSPVSIWEEDFSAIKALFDELRKEGVEDIEGHFARHPEMVRQCAEMIKIVDVNKAALDLHGAADKKELLAGLVNTFTQESFDIFRQELVSLWNGKTGMSSDVVVKTLTGERRYVTLCFSVCPGYEETLSRVLVSLIDITERKQVEDALRQSEEEKTILNQIANIFLTVPDEAMYGEVLAVVLQAMKSRFGVFGYMAENGDLVTPSLTREIWNECQIPDKSIVFPADSWGKSLWGRAIREKRSFCSSGPFHTPQGHIHIDHFLTVPIIYGGETIGLTSVANKEGGYTDKDKDLLERIAHRISPILHARLQRDTQERGRMAAEKDLKESEEKYRLLITNAGEAIFIVQDEIVRFPNPKAVTMIGYSAEELSEFPFVNLIHPDDRDTVFEAYLRLLEGERRSKPYPFRLIDKEGKEIWVQLTTAPITWDKKPGILCFLRDVTEEKKLEAQFRQAQKMEAVGRLAGGVAHDFNNLLTGILNYTELSREGIEADHPIREWLDEITNEAQRSINIVRQLLAFSRRQVSTPQIIDVNGTIMGMLKLLRRLIGEDIDLVWVPGADLWPVKMDPAHIDQLLANLCINARDAITATGRVTVETQNTTISADHLAMCIQAPPGDYVALVINDTGSGMDEETLAHIFEPFFTTKEVGMGTGLGLATVHGIVKQCGGGLEVSSEPNLGTTFRIYLPRTISDDAASEQDTVKAVDLPYGSETVLLVEDEKALRVTCQKFLEAFGYTVLTAETPEKALDKVKEYPEQIHLLITDMIMPGMTGYDLAKRLTRSCPSLKCLFISGYTADVIADRVTRETNMAFLAKPFTRDRLIGETRRVLDE